MEDVRWMRTKTLTLTKAKHLHEIREPNLFSF